MCRQSDSVVGGTLCEWMQQSQSGTHSTNTDDREMLNIGPTVSLSLIRRFRFGNMNKFRQTSFSMRTQKKLQEHECLVSILKTLRKFNKIILII